jgi:hypothetical protein
MATKLSSQLQRISAQWPADPFRPHLQLKTFLDSLSQHPNLTPGAVEAAQSLQNNVLYNKVCDGVLIARSAHSPNQYKLGKRMMKPASAPLHYDRLAEAFEKSAKGVGRPWWKIFFNIW